MESYWTKRRKIKANVNAHLQHVDREHTLLSSEPSQVIDSVMDSREQMSVNDILSMNASFDMAEQSMETSENVSLPHAEIPNQNHGMSTSASAIDTDFQGARCTIGELSDFEYENMEMTNDVDGDSVLNLGDDSDVERKVLKLPHRIGEWAAMFQVSHACTAYLMGILQDYFPDLPSDPRTLLHTIRDYEVRDIAGGSYYHFGMKSCVSQALASFDLSDLHRTNLNTVYVQINIDGLPLFKSSSVQFWPILGRIDAPVQSEPFIVGLFCGKSKPADVNEYMQEFVAEMQSLEHDGFQPDGLDSPLYVKVSCFICDAPAKAFIKQIKGHSGYYGCGNCVQKGQWVGKMTFPLVDAPLRTDAQFDEMSDEEHHVGSSPLKDLSLGMVTQFPLDFMHLVCLGVMKRLIWLWMKGPVANLTRIGTHSIETISSRLLTFSRFLPKEFPRKCRALNEMERWKATEFRQFLLYSGPVALKDVLSDDRYAHFLLLFVSIYCLSSPFYFTSHCQYAHELLCLFVQEFGKLYGKDMLVYNVHGLVHLAQDVKRFGPLESFSAFPFESFLGRIKKKFGSLHTHCNKLFAGCQKRSSSCQGLLNALRLHRLSTHQRRNTRKDLSLLNSDHSHSLKRYHITSKIPVRWPGQCYGFTLSLIFKYCGGIGLY